MNYRAFFILYKYINQLVYLFILFMHTKSETMAALTPSKLPKMLKVIDIDIEIMGVVNSGITRNSGPLDKISRRAPLLSFPYSSPPVPFKGLPMKFSC